MLMPAWFVPVYIGVLLASTLLTTLLGSLLCKSDKRRFELAAANGDMVQQLSEAKAREIYNVSVIIPKVKAGIEKLEDKPLARRVRRLEAERNDLIRSLDRENEENRSLWSQLREAKEAANEAESKSTAYGNAPKAVKHD